MLWPDGQPAADLLEDLGGIPPCPGRVVRPAGEAVRAGLGQVGSQAAGAAIPAGGKVPGTGDDSPIGASGRVDRSICRRG